MIVKLFILFICVSVDIAYGQDVETNMITEKSHVSNEKIKFREYRGELVKIQLFYECLCPGCRHFDTTDFKETVLEMASSLDIHLYPYGNAQTIDNGGGNYTFICQHGPTECYGNKLHACAIDDLQNITLAALYNSCLMDLSHKHGSDDEAADVCGTAMDIDSAPIKQCAKIDKGSELLRYYGVESKKIGYPHVPYVLINGVPSNITCFQEEVCKAFKKPPPRCKDYKCSNLYRSDFQHNYVETNMIIANIDSHNDVTNNKTDLQDELEMVKIQLFYECLCPDCRKFDTTVFKETVLEMGSYLDIHLYPYGNAKTIDNGGGNYTFTCQHGPAECYGNKLHACAIEELQNMTLAVLFNSCLMDYSHKHGSDDEAVNVCGTSMNLLGTETIKKCAKSERGTELLRYYGDQSKKIGFRYVPYVLINGVLADTDHFKIEVCKVFKKPPQQCNQNRYYRDIIWSKSNLENEVNLGELVKIELYYECLCPFSREFATGVFQNTVFILGSYLDIHLYPYGNAKTIDNGNDNYTFVCQHGPKECYGNMLHACAIDELSINSAILFNNCMMNMSRPKGSDDESADECGSLLDINSAPIKHCVNSDKAKQLIFHYGELSKKAGFKGVPYILVNEVKSSQDTFVQDVCGAFKNPPSPCKDNIINFASKPKVCT